MTTLSGEDFHEIHNLYSRYNRCVDFGDAEGFARTFTADGKFTIPQGVAEGPVALEQFVRDAVVRRGTTTRHMPYNIEIEATPAGAKGCAYFVLLRAHTGTQRAEILMSGRYADELVKTADGWRFSHRIATMDG